MLYDDSSLRLIHSFPTRRSSDLTLIRRPGAGLCVPGGDCPPARRAPQAPHPERTSGGNNLDTGRMTVVCSALAPLPVNRDRKSTRLNSSHLVISYAVFCLKKKHN